MPTLIDSLYVSLGLDPTEYKKGQKEAVDSSKKTKDALVKDGKAIEDAGKKAADGIKKIAVEALALFAIFTGSKSIGKFVTDLLSADAALGRFSRTVGLAPQYVGAIERVVGEVGGTADATASTIDGLSDSLTRFRTANGDLPQEFWQLRAMVGGRIDPRGSMVDFLDQLAAALQKVERTDPQKAAMFARSLKIDQGTYQLMLKYGDQLSKVIGMRKDLAPSDQDIANAQKFQEAWNNIYQAVRNLIENGVRALEPALTPIIKSMQEWVEANKGVIGSKLVEYANSIASAFKSAAENINSVVSVLRTLDEFNERSKKWEITKYLMGGAAAGNTPSNSTTYGNPNGMLSATIRKGSIAESIINYFSGSGSTPSTGRATGGPVTGGQAYMVGERGPEPFVPSTSGTIIPNDKLGGNLSVDGRPINRANPMPVTLSNNQGGGENWLQTLIGLFSGGKGGGGGGFFSTLFGGGGSGGNTDVKAVGNSAGVRGWWTAERQKFAYDYLRKNAGLSDSGAKGLISRWVNVESAGGPSASNNIGGGHYGIAQWSRSRGKSIWGNPNFEGQLALVAKELNGSEKKAGDALRKAATDKEGAVGASKFERAENYNPRTGIDDWTGKTLGGMRGLDKVLTGAKGAAIASGSTTNDNRKTSTSTSTSSTTIGKIEIHTQARDANGIAANLHDSIRRNAAASAANNGPN